MPVTPDRLKLLASSPGFLAFRTCHGRQPEDNTYSVLPCIWEFQGPGEVPKDGTPCRPYFICFGNSFKKKE